MIHHRIVGVKRLAASRRAVCAPLSHGGKGASLAAGKATRVTCRGDSRWRLCAIISRFRPLGPADHVCVIFTVADTVKKIAKSPVLLLHSGG